MSKSVVPAERISKVEEYYFSIKLKEIAKMNAEGAGVINLGIGSPDMPPTLKVREMLAKSAMEENVHVSALCGHPAVEGGLCGVVQEILFCGA